MKKSADILGLPVIGIDEGVELGTVKFLVFNPSEGTVAVLVIDDGKWYMGPKLLPFSSVASLGECAIIVQDSKSIGSVTNYPEFEQLLPNEIKIIGTKVLTKNGRIQGKVTEVIIDETGKIVACEVQDNSNNVLHIPAQRVITFGKDILIIDDNDQTDTPIESPITKPVEITSIPVIPDAPAAPEVPEIVPVQAVPQEEPIVVDDEVQTPVEEQEPAAPPADESAKKFDDKHRKYLLGKKASRRVETDSGVVIVEKGGEITEEVIQKAKLAGKFVELSMSI